MLRTGGAFIPFRVFFFFGSCLVRGRICGERFGNFLNFMVRKICENFLRQISSLHDLWVRVKLPSSWGSLKEL